MSTMTDVQEVMSGIYLLHTGKKLKSDKIAVSPAQALSSSDYLDLKIRPIPNTMVTITPNPSEGLYGSPRIFYNRFSLENVRGLYKQPGNTQTDYALTDIGTTENAFILSDDLVLSQSILDNLNVGLYVESFDEVTGEKYLTLVKMDLGDLDLNVGIPDSYRFLGEDCLTRYIGTKRLFIVYCDARWDSHFCYGAAPINIRQDYYPPVVWSNLSITSTVVAGQPIVINLAFEASTEERYIGFDVSGTAVLKADFTTNNIISTNDVYMSEYTVMRVPIGVTSTTISIPTLNANRTQPVDVVLQTRNGFDTNGQIIPGMTTLVCQILPAP